MCLGELPATSHVPAHTGTGDGEPPQAQAVFAGSAAVAAVDKAVRMRFPVPKREPTTWCQLAHHVLLASFILGTAVFAPIELPSMPLVLFMYLYADAYSAVLHATLDCEEALDLPVMGPAARGFQMHHDHPVASTSGVGLYRLFCDTVNIQRYTGLCALLFARHTALTARIVVLKWIMCAYGTQMGHYWSHVPSSKKPMLVRWLQRLHLLLPNDHHVRGHHMPPHNKNFAIVSGLSNPILNSVLRDAQWKVLLPVWLLMTLFDTCLIERLFRASA